VVPTINRCQLHNLHATGPFARLQKSSTKRDLST